MIILYNKEKRRLMDVNGEWTIEVEDLDSVIEIMNAENEGKVLLKATPLRLGYQLGRELTKKCKNFGNDIKNIHLNENEYAIEYFDGIFKLLPDKFLEKIQQDEIIGYKCVKKDMSTYYGKHTIYETNKIYEMSPDYIKLCESGFHFSLNIIDAISHYYRCYPDDIRIFKVRIPKDAIIDAIDTKVAASKIILEEEVTDIIKEIEDSMSAEEMYERGYTFINYGQNLTNRLAKMSLEKDKGAVTKLEYINSLCYNNQDVILSDDIQRSILDLFIDNSLSKVFYKMHIKFTILKDNFDYLTKLIDIGEYEIRVDADTYVYDMIPLDMLQQKCEEKLQRMKVDAALFVIYANRMCKEGLDKDPDTWDKIVHCLKETHIEVWLPDGMVLDGFSEEVIKRHYGFFKSYYSFEEISFIFRNNRKNISKEFVRKYFPELTKVIKGKICLKY